MARGVNGGQRDAAHNSAYRIDEIDAAWDDGPTSMILPVRVSHLPDEPTLVERDEPTLTLSYDEPTLTLRDEPTLTLHHEEPTFDLRDPALVAEEATLVLRDEPTHEFRPDLETQDASEQAGELDDYVDEDSIVVLQDKTARAGDLEVPDFRRRPRGQITRVAGVCVLACTIAAVGSTVTARARRPVATAPAPTPVRAPFARSAAPAFESKPPAPVVAAEPAVAAPAMNTVTVVIEVVPKRESIFRGRERLGSGLVAVNVEPNTRQRLTAVLGGYEKAKFTIDGTRDAMTVYLHRVPQLEATPAAASGSTPEAPSSSPPPVPEAAAPEAPPSAPAAE